MANLMSWRKKEKEIDVLAANLHRKGEMAALGVPDDAGVHGRLDTPAPLQVSHGVLVQVTGQHRGKAGTHAPGRKLESTLSRHKADAEKKDDGVKNTKQRSPLSAFHTHHRGVRLRNIFIPKRGPWVSPAPSSTCVHTQTFSRFRVGIGFGETTDGWGSSRTSPQPLADVTLLKARLMVPPPFPL